MTGADDHLDDADDSGSDDELPSFKREAAGTLSAQERELADRAGEEAANRPKLPAGAPDEDPRGAPHCSHGSHGSHGSW
jgi:hypothetical protein